MDINDFSREQSMRERCLGLIIGISSIYYFDFALRSAYYTKYTSNFNPTCRHF